MFCSSSGCSCVTAPEDTVRLRSIQHHKRRKSNNNLQTQNPLSRLSYLFVCVAAKVFAAAAAAAAALQSASILAQTGSGSVSECERKQTTSLAEHFALFCISTSAPTGEISFSRAPSLPSSPLGTPSPHPSTLFYQIAGGVRECAAFTSRADAAAVITPTQPLRQHSPCVFHILRTCG